MDYEKKYKESKAKMSAFLAKHDGFTISKDGEMYKELSEIFSELKESEDERIWIINYLSNRILNSTIIAEKENLKKAIAWLEKKGEQKPTEYPLCDTIKDKIGYYIINHFTTDSVIRTDVNSIVKAMEEGVRLGMKEQNPAWSEEDEEIYRKCICAMRASACGFPEEEKFVEQVDNWLKSIKDKVLRQNITIADKELTKAKKDAYNDALDKIEYHSGEPTFDDGWSAAIDYIRKKFFKERVQLQNGYNPYKEVVESIAEMCKHYDTASHSGLRDFYDNVKVKCKDAKEYDSLYPQNTWKPSDEQIACLQDAVARYNQEGFNAATLTSLLEQLKKLREE